MSTVLSFEQMFPCMAAVGDYLGGMRPVRFDDGMWQFRIQSIVYSPKLKPYDLEMFCQNNLDQYDKFYDENWDDIIVLKPLPAIKIFWLTTTE